MYFKKNVPLFLKRKLLEYNLTSKQFAEKSGIPLKTVNNFRQGVRTSPRLINLIKIADFFQCSIDEIFGRDPKYYLKVSTTLFLNEKDADQLTNNLKIFIKNKTLKHNLTLHKLSLNLGLNTDLLVNLFHPEPKIKSLSTLSICKLADYFDVSIDEMIGRVSYDSKHSNDIPTHADYLEVKGTKVSQAIKTFQEAAKPKDREASIENVALNMLKEKVDKNLISKVTGLSLDEINALAN